MRWLQNGFSYRPHPLSEVLYGPGRAGEIGKVVDGHGATRVLIVTSPSVRRDGLADRVAGSLGARLAGVFDGVRSHSPIEVVQAAADAGAALAADSVVSVGGGSCIDTAKGVVHFQRERTGRRPVHVAIPTTLSGAEFTHAAGITHGPRKRIYGPDLHCETVILDPEAAAITPTEVFLPSGLNAIAHCVEGVSSVEGNGVSDAMMLHAIRLLRAALPDVKARPGDVEARGRALMGAALAAMECWRVPMGMEHALAHVVGGRFRAPHAVVHAILIAPVMRFNRPAVVPAQVAIAEALGVARDGAPDAEVARRGIEGVLGLLVALGIPTGLRALGVRDEDAEGIAAEAVHDPCFATNPRPVKGPEEVVAVVRDAL